MTDNKVEIEVGIEASLSGVINRVLSGGVADAQKIEAALNGALKNLQAMQAASKKMGVLTGAVSRGGAVSQVINASSSGQAANARADRTLADILNRVSTQLAPGASEAALKRAFREALVAEGRISRAPANQSARGYAAETLDPLFQRAQMAMLAGQAKARALADQKLADKAARDQDTLARQALAAEQKTRANRDKEAEKAERAVFAQAQKDTRARALQLQRQDEATAKRDQAADYANRAFDQKARQDRNRLQEKADRVHNDWESTQRLKAESRAQKYAASMLRAGDLNGMLARGNTDGAAGLLQRARRTLSGRPGVDDQFIDGLLREAGGKVDAARAINNIKEAERELKALFAGINKFADAAERERIREQSLRDVSSARGLNPTPLGRVWDGQEEVRRRREGILGAPVAPPERAPRPERAPGRGSSALGRLGGRMELFADYAGISAIVGAVGYTASQTAALEKSLATLKAISGATDGQMQSLSKTIMEVGQNSSYSMGEITAAATTLAQAGYTVGEVAKVLPNITNLAMASGSDLQVSTDIVSSVLTVFDMNLDRAAYVSDALTQALNGSKLSMDQFALGMQYAGNSAAQGGVSFEELIASLGAMSNAGIRSGSTLGTGLTAMFQELMAPSEKFRAELEKQGISLDEVNLETHGLVEVLETLDRAHIDSSKGFELFDTRAARAYSALVNNQEYLKLAAGSFSDNGAAALAAAGQMDTLLTQLTRLGNAAVQFTSVFGAPIMEALKGVVGGLASFLSGLASASPLMQALTTGTTVLGLGFLIVASRANLASASMVGWWTTVRTATLGNLAFAGTAGVFNLAMGGIVAGIRMATAATLQFTAALLLNPFTWLVVGLAAAAAAFTYFSGAADRASSKADQFREQAANQRAEVEELSTTLDELNKFTNELVGFQGDVNAKVEEARDKFSRYGDQLDGTITKVEGLTAASRALAEQLAATRLERLADEKADLAREKGELQVVAAGNVDNARAALARLGHSRESQLANVTNSTQWANVQDGDITGTDIRRLRDFINGLARNTALNEVTQRQLADAVAALEKGGIRVLLDNNALASGLNGVNQSAANIESSPVFQAWNTRMFTLADGWTKAMVDGVLPLAAQTQFINTALPTMLRDANTAAESIVAAQERTNGVAFPAQERRNQLSQAREALLSDTNFEAMRSAYGPVGEYTSRADISRRQSSLEASYKSSPASARAGIQTELETLFNTSWLKDNAPNLVAMGQARGEYLRDRLEIPLSSAQAGASNRNYTLELATTNSRQRLDSIAAGTRAPTAGSVFTRPTSGGLTPGQGFGVVRPDGSTHRGQDLIAPAGTRVNAPAGGMATSGSDAINGNWVEIDHGGGLVSKLIHLTDAVVGLSAVATRVEQGDQVGRSGNTGRSRGAHLHQQLTRNGTPIDPESMVGQTVGSPSEIVTRDLAALEAEWAVQVGLRQQAFDEEHSALSAADKVGPQSVLNATLALERAALFRETASGAYEDILTQVGYQADEAVLRAVRAVGEGETNADALIVSAQTLLAQTRDLAIAAAEASMAPGRDRTAKITEALIAYADGTANLALSVLQTQLERAARIAEEAAAERDTGFNIRRSGIDALSNANNQRNGSSAYATIRRRDGERLDVEQARAGVSDLRDQYRLRQEEQARADGTLTSAISSGASEGAIGAAKAELDRAALATAEMSRNLREAEAALQAMTAEAFEFATPMDAIRGGWAAFVEEANVARPVLNTLADGLAGTFETARGGFKTLIVDVMSGTKSMGDAFKDLAVSILQSLLDLAAEIIAQEILTMIITSIAGQGGGGKTGAGFGSKSGVATSGSGGGVYYQGGMIPRRAAGGSAPSPNRDSVLTFMQPGEFVMSKTATDFIGADTLSEMNASGNRRMKQLPTVASAMPKRVPDEVNVWVVPPSQRPPTSKKDIVAAVTEDMMLDGQTRRLIKAIQVGAM